MTDFDRELKAIIFSHVPEESRLGLDSLDAVVAYRTSETQDAINLLKRLLCSISPHRKATVVDEDDLLVARVSKTFSLALGGVSPRGANSALRTVSALIALWNEPLVTV